MKILTTKFCGFFFCFVLFMPFQLQAFGQADHQYAFFFSEKFAQRFDLDFSTPAEPWLGTMAVVIEKDVSEPYPFCKVDLYLGDDIEFDYPGDGDYMDYSDRKINDLLFFTHKLSNKDRAYTTKKLLEGANKLMVKVLNKKGREIASASLTIEQVFKNIVEGVHLIKTRRLMCELLYKKGHQSKLIFEALYKDGDVLRVQEINEYVLPDKLQNL